ncbi:Uncharacterised protein [Segatella copri]|nr:Uncharacterised protein [Segatella copri]
MNGSSIQNSMYSMFACSKSLVSSLRIIPPQLRCGFCRVPSACKSVTLKLYGPGSLG